ncbi:MAG: hypothetical protein PHN38_08325 [Sulfurospirillaceae bacterium]|nr:hypothetical protein [Sulfurospirillaceae bacterium]MDD3463738.1 hypothetical protein [Sulfurospirillaceae bacterium]
MRYLLLSLTFILVLAGCQTPSVPTQSDAKGFSFVDGKVVQSFGDFVVVVVDKKIFFKVITLKIV